MVGQRGRFLVDMVFVVVGNDPGVRIETAKAPRRAEEPATRAGRLLGLLSCLENMKINNGMSFFRVLSHV